MATLDDLKGIDPKVARRAILQAARRDLMPFLAYAHPAVMPESSFIDAYHLRVLAWHVQQVVEGKIRRLLIAVPPRHFKSYVASVAAPAWALGLDPSLRIVCASYGTDLSKRFAEESRAILLSPAYRALFPTVELKSKTPAVERLNTTAAGYRFATSIGGTLTGIGADIAIIDDPLKAADAYSLTEREAVHSWFKSSLMTRFDKPAESRVIVVMQRLHQDDLIGRLLQEEGWNYVKLPGQAQERITVDCGRAATLTLEPGELLFPERFNEAALAQQLMDFGEAGYNAQILQTPSPSGGAMVKLKWFQRYDTPPPKSQIEMVVQVWDTALVESQTADYSVCTTWAIAGKRLFLLDVLRRRLPYHELEKLVLAQRKRHDARLVFVEETGTGVILHQNLHRLAGHKWLMTVPAKLGKQERMAQQVPKLERKRVFLPKTATWLEAFEHEVSEFPFGRYDDQVDSLAYFLNLFDYGRSPALWDLSMWAGCEPGKPVL